MASFFNSSVGKKITLAGLGLFLILFLLVHLGINLLLIIFSERDSFNIAAHFMASNILIKVFEILLFGGFLIHIIYGFILQIQNWIARPVRYRIPPNSESSFFSKYMIHSAVIIFIFLIIHLSDFYFKSKFFGGVETVSINGKEYEDLGLLVIQKFKIPAYTLIYLICLLFLGFHLLHGFQSAFQTLGLNHRIYTPLIKKLGVIYTFLVVTGFFLIPLYIYFFR